MIEKFNEEVKKLMEKWGLEHFEQNNPYFLTFGNGDVTVFVKVELEGLKEVWK